MPSWHRIETLFDAALQRSPAEREAFLREQCGGDHELYRELVSLLIHDTAASTAGQWAASAAARLVARPDAVAHDDALAAGAQLGPYTIVDAIGRGAMGQVYRAIDSRLRREVAIKALPPIFIQDPRARARLHREAQMLAALNHPNIAGIYDLLEVDGGAYLVLEYVAGSDLSERLRDGGLPIPEAIDVACQIALALKFAHERGIVHRDLKPANIKITPDGRVKVLDFGIARPIAEATATGDATRASGAWLNTLVAGTPAYMSPEQALGRQVDHRADVWAFGCVLFELLSGVKALAASAASGEVAAVLRASPDFSRLPRQTPRPVLKALERCLQRDLEMRAPDADAVLELLEPLSRRSPLQRHRLWAIAAIVTLIIAGVTASRALIGARGSSRSGSPALVIGDVRQLTADEPLAIDPSLSPDGRFVAYSAGSPARMRAFIRPIGGGPAVPVAPAEDGSQLQPRWSPDGMRLLYLTPEAVYLARPSQSHATRLYAAADFAGTDTQSLDGASRGISGAVWAPDGRTIVVAHGRVLRRIGAEPGTAPETLAESPFELHSCDWSASSTWIACASGNWHFAGNGGRFGNLAPSAIALVPQAGGRVVEITDRAAHNKSPVWSRDGRRLFFLSNRQGASDVYAVDVSLDGSTPHPPVRLTTGLGAQSIALSPDRTQLAYAAYVSRANIWSLPLPEGPPVDTARAVQLTFGNQIVETLRVSHDGAWLVYDSNLRGNADIFRVPTSGGRVEQLTADPADEFAPDLSPDGRWLAYHSWKLQSRDIFVQPIAGGTPQAVTASRYQESYPYWSPDGTSIAFADQFVENGVARGLYVVQRAAAGSWNTPISVRSGLGRATWSGDGRELVTSVMGRVQALNVRSGKMRVIYAPASGSTDPRAEGPTVGPEGNVIYFKSHDKEGRAFLWSVPLAGGQPRLLLRCDDLSRPSSRSDFAVGANQMFFTLDERQSNIWIGPVVDRAAAR